MRVEQVEYLINDHLQFLNNLNLEENLDHIVSSPFRNKNNDRDIDNIKEKFEILVNREAEL
jgi:hypothetical protein